MKKLLLLTFVCCAYVISFSQILISADPTDTLREKSAAFEVKSRTGGFLPPRLSTAERKAITKPAPGLIVFDTTKQMFYGFTKDLGWRPFSMGVDTSLISDPYSPTVEGLMPGDNFGHSVRIWGNLAVVGAPGTDVGGKIDQGALYVFRKNGTQWGKIQRITAPDGAAEDFFGNHIAMTAQYVIVAAYGGNVGENLNQGSVYVYKIEADSLKYSQKVTSPLASSNDQFGSMVLASQNNLLIGASNDDIGVNTDQGSAYYFALENGSWIEKQKIIQDSAAEAKDYFGYGISINGNWAAIGHSIETAGDYGLSANSVFLYELVGGTWLRRQEIVQPDDLSNHRDGFGFASYLTDSTLTIGAWLKDEPIGNKDRGAAYLFKKSAGSWGFVKKFSPSDPNTGDTYGDYFASKMRASGQYLMFGNGYEDLGAGNIDKGAFYLCEWKNNEWQIQRKVQSPSPETNDLFAHDFDIEGENIIISAFNKDAGRGKVYFFSLMN